METHTSCFIFSGTSSLNSNMGCMETIQAALAYPDSLPLNSNMGCMETKLVRVGKLERFR